ncbi:hypothetical protein [Streptomyces rimosus]
MSDQSVFVLGSDLEALEPTGFETEQEFQELLARHPRMLDFGSLADGRPRRLVLMAREMGVATSPESGSAYWLDHLFVDADGVPTLVEVKRASDTRIRREVVGQMLDYAANAARCWPAALLQSAFQETCAGDGRLLEETYGKLLGDRSPEEFWMTVEERLAAGQMRLLFVADRIPLELRASVEFLNRQLRQTDVYAVELTQYRGDGDHRVLVPRIHGEVATAAMSSSGRRAARKTTRADMDPVLRARLTPELRLIVEALLDHATARGRLGGWNGPVPEHVRPLPRRRSAGTDLDAFPVRQPRKGGARFQLRVDHPPPRPGPSGEVRGDAACPSRTSGEADGSTGEGLPGLAVGPAGRSGR